MLWSLIFRGASTACANSMNDYHGPQLRKSRHNTKLDKALISGIFIFGLFLFMLISKEISIFLGYTCVFIFGFNIFEFPLPSGRTSLTVFAGFISLLFVREQFVQGLRPFLTYSCFRSKDNDKALDLNHISFSDDIESDKGVLFKTTLENIGGGMATMKSVEYRLSFKYGEFGDFESFSDIKTKMYENGLEFNKDYWISSFSKGWSIAKEKEVLIFEIPLRKSNKIFCLDIKFEYEGLLGDTYEKQVYCIPRHMRK